MKGFSLEHPADARPRGPWRVVDAIIAHLTAGPVRALALACLLATTSAASAGGDYGPLQMLAPGVYVQLFVALAGFVVAAIGALAILNRAHLKEAIWKA